MTFEQHHHTANERRVGHVYGEHEVDFTMPEKIVGVAIQYDGATFKLPRPYRHHDVIRMIAGLNAVGIAGPDVQGFVTNHNRFLDRIEALAMVKTNGQLAPGSIAQHPMRKALFSEDLW
jgi:hypothetical protein